MISRSFSISLGRWVYVLPVAIARVGEPEISSIVVLLDIVERREISSEEIVYQHLTMARGRVDEYKLRWMVEVTFIAKHDLLALAAIRRSSNGIECSTSVRFV